ncbi:MAG: ClbS/DfsB family four-helix bundle protein [Actinomycetia bacterium]|nr:ClbS/DfsB family four-helix bundle protein [Actinomycetes bacterium]
MPEAVTKEELLEVTAKEFDKLELLLSGIDQETALRKDDEDTSIKDTVAHRAHWIGLYLGWYRDGLAGKKVHFPAEGYKWNELNRYNADLRAAHSDLSWDDVCGRLRRSHDELVAFLEAHPNEDLYSGPMTGANNNWTPGRWVEAVDPSHYRSASKYIRSRLRTTP